MNRQFYIKPLKEIDLGTGNILRILRPLYGVPEAGTHWFRTYHKHYIERLGLTISTYDPCLLYNDQAVVGLQTDDTLFLATKEYARQEETELRTAKYTAKPVEQLTDKTMIFNGSDIDRKDDRIELTQTC